MQSTTEVQQIKLMVSRTRQLFRMALFKRGLLPGSEPPPQADLPDILTVDMLCDCRHVAEIAASAFQNKSKLKFQKDDRD
jgi:hypothetical protein